MSVGAEVKRDWEICLHNPDPPYEEYSYPYYLRAQEGDWAEFVERLGLLNPDRVVVITEEALPLALRESFVERVRTSFPTTVLPFAGGEAGKHLDAVHHLLDQALAAGVTRSSVLVALGGGLVGNVAGLVAGICLRGLPLVQVPTTLLAQSDSCVSLKQGVNGTSGKNHIGLFNAPALVWSHLSFLETLPPREIRAALCEAVKNALAVAPDQIHHLLQLLKPQAQYALAQLVCLIEGCLEAKMMVMRNDALEKHEAVALEYGHTVGHAVELLARGALSHGEAIGIGMCVEGAIAWQRGMLSRDALEMHQTLLQANGSPTTIPAGLETEALLALMRHDNKRGLLHEPPGLIAMVQLEGLGRPHRTNQTVLTLVAEHEVRSALDRCREQRPERPGFLENKGDRYAF